MESIEFGEYIRTKQGDISKVRYVDEENIFLEDCVWSKNDLYEKTDVLYIDDEEIAKHSKNIIDLIEVGDFVNGNKVHSVDFSTSIQTGEKYLVIDKIYQSVKYFYEKDIKTIVTKQQFFNMEYKINE